jgi:hypothetical protein
MSQLDPPSAGLEFPQPPSFKDTQADSAATLAWLKENIATIYLTARTTSASQDQPSVLTRSAYLSVYTTAHNYCEITKHTYKTKPDDPTPPNGQDLYRSLEQIIRNHCSEIRARVFTPENSTGVNRAGRVMIQEYLAQWKMFEQHLAPLFAHLMRHLERVWIRRELDEKRKGLHFIKDLHTMVWKEEILHQVGGYSTTAAAVSTRSELEQAVGTLLQEQSQVGVESDGKDLAQGFSESLRAVGVNLDVGV